MSKPYSLLLLLIALPLLVGAPAVALAQDDEEYPDDDDDDEYPDDDDERSSRGDPDEPRARPERATTKKRPSREVVKGVYAKANMGAGIALPPFRKYTSGTSTQVDFSVGGDVIDRLGFTLTIEGSFFNMISNAAGPFDQRADPTRPCNTGEVAGSICISKVQGGYNLIGGTAAVRFGPNFGGRRVKRLHLAIQVGGGVGYSPLLVDETTAVFASNGPILLQGRAVGLITPGVGLEYYTRLSHFSIGIDVDFNVAIGGSNLLAMWVTPSLFIKYTF